MNRDKISFLLRIILSAVFFLSAFSKIIAPGLLEIILTDHGIAGSRESAAVLVRLLIGFEFFLAFMLLQKSFLKLTLSAVILFLTAFTIYLGYVAIGLKDGQNCGCFGAAIAMNPVESIAKNIVLIIISVILFLRTKEKGSGIILPVVFLIASFAGVFLFAPVKSHNGFIFSKYTSFINGGRADLSEGKKLVLFMSLDCDHCQKLAKEIVELKKKYELPEIYTLFFQENEVTAGVFFSKTGFSYPYKIIPGEEFFEMIGANPPRCYYLNGGNVVEFWDKDIKEKIEALVKK